MKTLLIAAYTCLSLASLSWGQPACPVTIKTSVEVTGQEYSLADLLSSSPSLSSTSLSGTSAFRSSPAACSSLWDAAAGVRLGSAPLEGSVRVLTGSEVRSLLNTLSQKIAGNTARNSNLFSEVHIPERITVRRSGPRASCADLGSTILPHLDNLARPAESSADKVMQSAVDLQNKKSLPEIECGAADRISPASSIETIRTVWNSALQSWEISARCVHPADCVPFLVRVKDDEIPAQSLSAHALIAPPPRSVLPLVRPGESVSLLWDQGGIRLTVAAVCLDRGSPGEAVRARIMRGGGMVRAVVESAGRLRVIS